MQGNRTLYAESCGSPSAKLVIPAFLMNLLRYLLLRETRSQVAQSSILSRHVHYMVGYRVGFHIMADQIANIFARRCVNTGVTGSTIDEFPQFICQK